MSYPFLAHINVPTALVNRARSISNIESMAAKAARQNIRFRPHFKTHQSAGIGQWFRELGVKAITVSSVRMGAYFSQCGWEDILIAFPVNIRELSTINDLAARSNLSLLVESTEVISVLAEQLTHPVGIWIKVDTGMRRAGISYQNYDKIKLLCLQVLNAPHLNLRGILTHAGQTYHANSVLEILCLYKESNQRMYALKRYLIDELGVNLEISVGDTPGCWLSEDLGAVDEIRPGNFVFFDAMMLDLGVCQPKDVALIVACPVVAKHEDRLEALIYGGAVHLSKDFLIRSGRPFYGYAVDFSSSGWSFTGKENYVLSLSQEHGVVKLIPERFDGVKVGDLLGIMPVHACLAVNALGYLLDFEGNRYETMRSH